MSNCLNSGIYKIYILTQYNSTSLNRYLNRTYDLSSGIPIGGWIRASSKGSLVGFRSPERICHSRGFYFLCPTHSHPPYPSPPPGGDGFTEVVAATQSPDGQRWSEGPADSVRQWVAMMESNAKARSLQDILVLPR